MINYRFISYSLCLFIVMVQFLTMASPAQADCPASFGNFEVTIPGVGDVGTPICDFINGPKAKDAPITTLVGKIINIITALIVIAGLISIIIGAYFYMTAGGDSGRLGTAKEFIISALSGIVLALVAWLILNTISGQFASQTQEPKVILPPKVNLQTTPFSIRAT